MAKKKAVARKRVAKKKAKKKAAHKKQQDKGMLVALDSLVRQVSVDFALGRLDDMPVSAGKTDAQIPGFLSPKLGANSCYFHLIPEKGVISVSTKMRDLRGDIVRKEVCKAVGFDPFMQKGMLPAKLAQYGMNYSYHDVQELMKALCSKIGEESLAGTMKKLEKYVQFMQNMGEYTKVVDASIHPYVVAMTVVGAAKLPPKKRRLRNIMLQALCSFGNIEEFEKSEAWTAWKNRVDSEQGSSETDLLHLIKENIDDLFVIPDVASFCKSAEELGRQTVLSQRAKGYRSDTNHYFTEGYEASQNYSKLVAKFQDALMKSVL
jgi:hypothetical protein